MLFQNTLAREVTAKSVGLHSGKIVTMTLKPGQPRSGIVFVRTDLAGKSVKVSLDNVDFSKLQLATVLAKDEVMVQTTEHLLSAFYGAGVDNAVVELDGPEVPIMDGSAAPFLFLIEEAGLKQQAIPRKVLRIEKPIAFKMGEKWIEAKPAKDFRVSYEIHYDHPLIRRQTKTVVIDQAYEGDVAQARTFGFMKEVAFLQSRGLIKGGSLDNAVVLDGDGILNESLRMHDEFVSHKILDFVGDMFVSGYRFQGHFSCNKAGHEVHAHFLRHLLQQAEAYSLVEQQEPVDQAGTLVPMLQPVH